MKRVHPRELWGAVGALAGVVLVRVLDARTDLDVRGVNGLVVVVIGFALGRWAWSKDRRP